MGLIKRKGLIKVLNSRFQFILRVSDSPLAVRTLTFNKRSFVFCKYLESKHILDMTFFCIIKSNGEFGKTANNISYLIEYFLIYKSILKLKNLL